MSTQAHLKLESTNLIPLSEVSNSFQTLTLEEKIERTSDVIKGLLADGKHLLLASSFGKDSGVLLNIFLQAMKEFVTENGSAPCCIVVNSNTLVESPLLDAYSRLEAAKVTEYCERHNLPVTMHIVEPSLSNNYLVNIIGGRTITVDSANDAKCSIMMKLNPINSHKNRIFKQFGKENVVTLVGTRFSESPERGRAMKDRGDSYDSISINTAGDKVISPIAEWELDDIFFYIGYVRSNKIECYSDFEALVETYRDINGGECMVNVYTTGQASKTPCGGRSGCWICLKISEDKSMENMLKRDENAYMRPLNDLRNYLVANQYDPSKRNWLARTLNDDGSVTIAPNSYSPDYCETLLRLVLSIQMRENRAAAALGIAPRFTLLRLKDVIAIEVLWARYGYHTSARALQIFDDVVVQGEEFDVPTNQPIFHKNSLPRFSAKVSFADKDFFGLTSGLRDVEAIIADCERTVTKADGRIYSDVNTSAEFTVDEEGADLFFQFEYERFLERYTNPSYCPTQVFHYFLRQGTVSLHRGGHAENDRMLRMANQIHRKGITKVLNNPNLLLSRLSDLAGSENVNVVIEQQCTLF